MQLLCCIFLNKLHQFDLIDWLFDVHRNQQGQQSRDYNRPHYGGQFSRSEHDSNGHHWRGGGGNRHTGGHYHHRRDQFLPKDNYNRVNYAGMRGQSSHDGPAAKYSRQSDDGQSHHWFDWQQSNTASHSFVTWGPDCLGVKGSISIWVMTAAYLHIILMLILVYFCILNSDLLITWNF